MNKFGTAVAAVCGLLTFGFVGAAAAQSNIDPTAGAYDTGVGNVQSFITDTAAGPLFVLAAVVVAIMVGLRWLKKSRSAAS